MIGTVSLLMFFKIVCQILFLEVQGLESEVVLNFEQLATLDGYPVEIHQVFTEDEYILNMYRIPHGSNKTKDEPKNKSAILIVHGMGGAAMNFIVLGKGDAPAYYFADRGFDVWLICARGVDCQNPRKHKRYDWNKDPQYWEYSLHEIGIYDVAAAVDVVLKVTGQEKIFTIGHSAGGPELYMLVTERPEYNNKIKIITNYGGGTIIENMDYPFIRFLLIIFSYFRNLLIGMGIRELFPLRLIVGFLRPFCADPDFKKACFSTIPGLLGNVKTTLIDEDIVPNIYNYAQRLSIFQVSYYAGSLLIGGFRKYDWGPKKNMKIYGEKIPPSYNMSKCTCASAFFYGTTDSFSTPEDNWALMDTLQNTIMDYEIGPKFHHLDFTFAKNATHMLYEPTVRLYKDFDEGRIPPKITKKRRRYDDIK